MSRRTGAHCSAQIEGLSHDGRGVARVDGKTVFIEGALPGERVRYRVLRSKPRFDEARVEELLGVSAQRIEPGCPHYGRCGGCNLQHLSPAAQLAAKQQTLSDALQRIADMQPALWLDPVTSAPWEYRARARLAIQTRRAEPGVSLGLRREGSREVEALAACPVLTSQASALIAPLARLLGELEQPGNWREAWIASGEPGLALGLCDNGQPPHAPDIERLQRFCAERDVLLQTGTRDAGRTRWSEPHATLRYATGCSGVELQFQPGQFTQANRAVNRALIAQLGQLLSPQPGDHLLDLYCGLGNFSLPLAARVARVTGIEGDAALLECARANAEHNGIDNARFLQADLAADPSAAAWTRARYDLIVLDPPRAGAAALTALLPRLGARRLCYVSCNAATLARDARTMCGAEGFRLLAAGVLDMFPQTSHFESLALFGR